MHINPLLAGMLWYQMLMESSSLSHLICSYKVMVNIFVAYYCVDNTMTS